MKLIHISAVLLLLSLMLNFSSCVNCIEAEGEIKTRSVKLDDFTKIDVEIPANIKLIIGDSAKVEISAPNSIISQILTIVKRNRLNLEGNICSINNDKINIVITVPGLSAIKIKGNADIYSEMPIRTDKLDLKISGSGNISLNVFANNIVSHISGSGGVILNGTCQSLDITIDGSGVFKGLGLNTYKAGVSISGSGIASVIALNKLDATVNGSGEISYSGEPKLSVDINGSGKITKIN